MKLDIIVRDVKIKVSAESRYWSELCHRRTSRTCQKQVAVNLLGDFDTFPHTAESAD